MDFARLEAFSDGVTAIIFAPTNQWVSDALYIAVAVMWFIPDKRVHIAAHE